MPELSVNIFNTNKTDYNTPSLFMGQPLGLFDSINKPYPKIFDLYKKMKSLDWSETDFPFTSCNVEFKTCSKSTYDIMLRTLAWQWEADSIASRTISVVTAPFVTNNELQAAWQEVAKSETVHALTYSEIVRSSFDNPEEVFKEILAIKEAFNRTQVVTTVIDKAYITGHKLALGLVERNQQTYNDIFMFTVAMFALERVQFMPSFTVTFAIGETGAFMPIAQAVQRVCQDEYEVQSVLDKTILEYEMQNEYGLMAFNQCREQIQELIDDVVETEFAWIDYLFSEGRQLTGMNPEKLKNVVLFFAKDMYNFFGMKSKYELPTTNPVRFLEHWIDISKIQGSPQEQKEGAYLVGAVINDASEEEIAIQL